MQSLTIARHRKQNPSLYDDPQRSVLVPSPRRSLPKERVGSYKSLATTAALLLLGWILCLIVGVPKKKNSPTWRNQIEPNKETGKAANGKSLELSTYSKAHCQGSMAHYELASQESFQRISPESIPKSLRVKGDGLVAVYVGPYSDKQDRGVVMEVEGCVDVYRLFVNQEHIHLAMHASSSNMVLTAQKQIPTDLQKQFATTKHLSQPHTRIVFSATSSEYFGYQLYANALGFLQSNQTDASWMRLLSAHRTDDLSDKFPTFTAPRSLYSFAYSPINKPDIIDKWIHSLDAPHPQDTIVVIDTDNWLLNDLDRWATQVASKRALGQSAYYSEPEKEKKAQQLWRELCLSNCQNPIVPVGVPYLIKASDLKEVAPLWRTYSIEIRQRLKTNNTFKDEYDNSLGVGWTAEMFGYNFACAHVNMQTKMVNDLQVRDMDTTPIWKNWDDWNPVPPMIHIGRAFYPSKYKALAAPWISSDQSAADQNRIQVWCKFNQTAAKVKPWPLHEMEFASYHTLRLLHESTAYFGPMPVNETFRNRDTIALAIS